MNINVDLKFLRDAAQVYGDGNEKDALYGLKPATEFSVGIDLRACIECTEIQVAPGERYVVGSGIAIEPKSQSGMAPVAGFVYSRSGLGAKKGLIVAQGVGVIDPDYRGEIIVWLLNTSDSDIVLQRGDRMAQLVFLNYYQPAFNIVSELGTTVRGAGGFGHTGK